MRSVKSSLKTLKNGLNQDVDFQTWIFLTYSALLVPPGGRRGDLNATPQYCPAEEV